MEEDLFGPFKSFALPRVTRCDRCGKPIQRSAARISRHGLQDDTLSEYEELCDECSLPSQDEVGNTSE